MTVDLDDVRKDIDEVNKEIIELVKRRMDLVVQVAEYKEKNNMEIIDEEREEKVKIDFEERFEKKGLPRERGRELASILIQTAVDLEEDLLDRSVSR